MHISWSSATTTLSMLPVLFWCSKLGILLFFHLQTMVLISFDHAPWTSGMNEEECEWRTIVNTENAPVRTMCCRGTKKSARKAAGNLLISANYFSRGTPGGLKGFVSACQRSKIGAVTFSSAESNTNKQSDNGAQENDNPGGGVFNPRSGLVLVKRSGGSTRTWGIVRKGLQRGKHFSKHIKAE